MFAHNGHLEGDIPLQGRFRPEGTTDSEAAFCWILEGLERQGVDPSDRHAVFQALVRASEQLARQGIFNCLMAEGRWLFAYAGTRLHCLTRRAPFAQATLADADLSVDFAELAGHDDVVTMISTEPLTCDEVWQPLAVGEAVLYDHGERVEHALPELEPVEA